MNDYLIYVLLISLFLISLFIINQLYNNNSDTSSISDPSLTTNPPISTTNPTPSITTPVSTTTAPSSTTNPVSTTTAPSSTTTPVSTTTAPSSTTKPVPTTTPSAVTNSPLVGGLINTFTDPKVYEAIALQIALQIAVKQGILAAAKYSSKLGVKTVENVATKVGEEALQQLGIKASTDVAEKAAVKLSETVGEKVTTKLGAQTAVAAVAGPVAPIVEASFLAFDVLSLGLDLGDAGGYNKMGTKQAYLTMRDGINTDMNQAFTTAGVSLPIIVGPLDDLITNNPTGYNMQLQTQITNLVSGSYGQPMRTAITNDLTSGAITAADLNNQATLDRYTSLLDMDTITNVASENLCSSLGGKTVNLPNDTTNYCSYSDKFSCENSYTWPLSPNDTYCEFKTGYTGYTGPTGVCIVAGQAMRGICEQNQIPYDSNQGTCLITQDYCLTKGADWAYVPAIQDYDCQISTGQDIAELIFGTTITRGLKQLFDPAQYQPCKPGETDTGLFCDTSCDNKFPNQGAFYDSIKAGCVTCGTGYVRTLSPIDAQDACKAGSILGDCSVLDPNAFQGGLSGDCYTCPSGYVRTLSLIGAPDACKAGSITGDCNAVHPGSFQDALSGNCFTCPTGYVRTLSAVTASDACKAGSITGDCNAVYPGSFQDGLSGNCYICPNGGSRNANLGGSGQECSNDCPAGYSKDLLAGLCYQCPSGVRNLNPVTSDSSCTACTSGSIYTASCPQGGTIGLGGNCWGGFLNLTSYGQGSCANGGQNILGQCTILPQCSTSKAKTQSFVTSWQKKGSINQQAIPQGSINSNATWVGDIDKPITVLDTSPLVYAKQRLVPFSTKENYKNSNDAYIGIC